MTTQSEQQLEKLPVKKIENELAMEFAEILTLKSDLEFSKECCQIILLNSKNNNGYSIIDIALWNSSIISFFRCFGGGVRQYKLNAENLFSKLNGEPMEFYEFLKNLRDKHLAHSVNIFEEVQVGVVLSKEEDSVIGLTHLFVKRILEDDKTMQQLIGFIDISLKKVLLDLKNKEIQLINMTQELNSKEIKQLKDLKYIASDPLVASRKPRTLNNRKK